MTAFTRLNSVNLFKALLQEFQSVFKQQGISQTELSRMTGLSRTTIEGMLGGYYYGHKGVVKNSGRINSYIKVFEAMKIPMSVKIVSIDKSFNLTDKKEVTEMKTTISKEIRKYVGVYPEIAIQSGYCIRTVRSVADYIKGRDVDGILAYCSLADCIGLNVSFVGSTQVENNQQP